MLTALTRGLFVASVVFVLVAASLWLLERPPDSVIPREFRGTWLDQGADCQDVAAQFRITGTTVNYDRLSFKADSMGQRDGDSVSLTGLSYASGDGQRETIRLRMLDNRTTLVIAAPDLRQQGPFVRCSMNTAN